MNERARWNDVLQTMPDETLRIRGAAFRELLGSGRPVPIQQAAMDAGLEPDRGFAMPRDSWRRSGWRRLPTTTSSGSRPLRADAAGTTACGYCGEAMFVVTHEGQPDESSAVGWVPNVSCSNVMAEFCPSALLFCSRSHLDEWRKTRPADDGQALDLESLAELGRSNWAPLVDADAA